jgi:tellurite resistance protein
MTIALDDAKFQQILDVSLGDQRLGPAEAQTVLQLARLAAEIDLEDDPDEQALLRSLTVRLCTATGVTLDELPRPFPVPTDDEERAMQVAALVRRLPTTGARDLALTLAYLLIVSDLELAPVEDALLAQLQRALTIPPERASQLIDAVARIVTPGAADVQPIATTVC